MERPWAIAGASVAGASHAWSGAPCQDAHAARIIQLRGEEILLVVASDGAGSAREAGTGARTAVAAIIEQAEAWLSAGHSVGELGRDAVVEWVKGTREQIAELAEAKGLTLRDYAATLIIAVIARASAAFSQIGDGAIVTRSKDSDWACIFWPSRGEYANTTYFVTDDTAVECLQHENVTATIEQLAVFTDGLEPLLLDYAGKVPHRPFFERMLDPLKASVDRGLVRQLSEHLAEYLGSPRISERADDDLTLVIASRLAQASSEPRKEPQTLSQPAHAALDTVLADGLSKSEGSNSD